MDLFKNRSRVILAIILLASTALTFQLIQLQLIDNSYASIAKDNVVKSITHYPMRGLIYDRNEALVVYNEPVFDIMIIPRQVKDIDTTHLCELLGIDEKTFLQKSSAAAKYASYKASPFMKQVSVQVYSKFQEFIFKFPGFYAQVRTKRHYPYQVGAHVFGDIGEVDSGKISEDSYYELGDYAGNSGIENNYESILRGTKGRQFVIVDVLNRQQGTFGNGSFDTLPSAGENIQTTIDIELQQYAEKLMKNKKGSIIALDPNSGEVLVFVSSPAYDPNILAGNERGKNYALLQRDTVNPLFNRPIMAQYPPGSTFKAFVALVALQNHSISKEFGYTCNGYYSIPGYRLSCSHNHPSAGNLEQGLQHSCNPYFWQTFRNSLDKPKFSSFEESYTSWYNHMRSFGFDEALHIDLKGEKPGNIPSPEYYNKLYGKNSWKSTTIISLGIGQGEILVTPLQLANAYAVIANKGFYRTPHLVKRIFDYDGDEEKMFPKIYSTIDSIHFIPVLEGLAKVVEEGTARRSKIPGIIMCGKTGTAQNPHGDDHSIFTGFAPKENPVIVVATIVENAGGGSRVAAPISSLIIEKYLNDSIAADRLWLEQSILETDLISPPKPEL